MLVVHTLRRKDTTFSREMQTIDKVIVDARRFFSRPFFSDPRTLLGLWLLLPAIATLTKIHSHNNFAIFRGVFWHTINQTPLYAPYPAEYFDSNHYGPLFSLVVAPFAVTPLLLGLFLWLTLMSLSLYLAIRKLPLPQGKQVLIYWFCAHELLTALFMSQFNIAIAAIIIATFVCVEKERDATATFFIMLGTFVKLYGIVGLAFFFFSRHKARFALSAVGWALLMFAAPMLISSPDYVVGQYGEWYASLSEKNVANFFNPSQNVSLLGLVRKATRCAAYSDLWLIVPGLVAFCLPYLRRGQYKHFSFRCTFLASVLLFVVLFSTGSESSTYIIALLGAAVWYVAAPWRRNGWDVALMVFAFLLTSMSPSDLFPKYIRETFVKPYALKALPCVLIWFKLVYEMLTRDYSACPPDGSQRLAGNGSGDTGGSKAIAADVTLWRTLRERLLKYEFVRFCIVGGISTVIHYGLYLLLALTVMSKGVWLSVAYTVGYVVSLVCNFYMTTYFTFQSKASVKKATGFGASHIVNYTLHIVLFNLFIGVGVWKEVAPILVLAIAVPTNYALLNVVYKKKRER